MSDRRSAMDTFTEPRDLVDHVGYASDRRAALAALAAVDPEEFDAPFRDVVEAFNRLPHCFTLQACCGHFLTAPEQDEHSLAAIPDGHDAPVRYRIACVAFCVQGSERGRALLEPLSAVTAVDPGYVQFGSADWFWEQWVDSYTLQVEPHAHRFKDQTVLTAHEARHTERVRDHFFADLRRVLASKHLEASTPASGPEGPPGRRTAT